MRAEDYAGLGTYLIGPGRKACSGALVKGLLYEYNCRRGATGLDTLDPWFGFG